MIMTKQNHQPSSIIVAFDCADMASAALLAEQLSPTLCRAKVGKELFTACGMAVIDMLHDKGYEIFLDLADAVVFQKDFLAALQGSFFDWNDLSTLYVH